MMPLVCSRRRCDAALVLRLDAVAFQKDAEAAEAAEQRSSTADPVTKPEDEIAGVGTRAKEGRMKGLASQQSELKRERASESLLLDEAFAHGHEHPTELIAAAPVTPVTPEGVVLGVLHQPGFASAE